MKNPFINALAASLYITLVASVMFYGTEHTHSVKSVIVPITILSLFTLSAAVMGYLFVSQPIQLYLDGKKKDAVNFFLKTVVTFAIITLITFVLLLSGISF